MKNKIIVSFLTVAILLFTNICIGFAFNVVNHNTSDLTFCGSGTTTAKSETINYSRKETETYNIKSGIPNYYSTTSDTGCANIAGAVIIGYYDRFCEELIPNCKTYMKLGSTVKYTSIGTELNVLIAELKQLMGTDVNTSGTTFNGYQQGMCAYVNNRNYTYTTEDLGKLNFVKYKTAVQSEKPVTMFLSVYSIVTSNQDSGTSETINYDYNTTAHVVVGYGYRIDTYYNSNNSVIATRTYLKIASGLNSYGLSYLCLDGKSKIEYAISTEIK